MPSPELQPGEDAAIATVRQSRNWRYRVTAGLVALLAVAAGVSAVVTGRWVLLVTTVAWLGAAAVLWRLTAWRPGPPADASADAEEYRRAARQGLAAVALFAVGVLPVVLS